MIGPDQGRMVVVVGGRVGAGTGVEYLKRGLIDRWR